jgi:hypothetical protein
MSVNVSLKRTKIYSSTRFLCLLWQRDGCVRCHGLLVCLRSHNLAITDVPCQQLEVVDIERWSKGVHELGLLVCRIGEGMRCSYGHDNIITSVRVNRLCRFRCGSCVPSKSDGSFGYWSVLVMSMVGSRRIPTHPRRSRHASHA